MNYQYCEAYGFDATKIKERLRLFELSKTDEATGEVLYEFVIEPNAKQIVHHFYKFLFQHDEFSPYLPADRIDALRKTQTEYLLTLGRKISDPEYFDMRLRVGVAHDRIGMPLALYECAYQKLRTLILERIPTEFEKAKVIRLQLYAIKVISLDMSLALDSYMLAGKHSLEESVDHLQKQNKKYKYWSEIDPLTHVLNRTNILNRAKNEIVVANMELKNLFLIMMDFNCLRDVNDKYGHLVGDHVMKASIEKICDVLGTNNHIGRYGGDEFVITVLSDSPSAAETLVKKIRTTIEAAPVSVGKHSVKLTASFGVAKMEKDDSISRLLHRADQALLAEKTGGGNGE